MVTRNMTSHGALVTRTLMSLKMDDLFVSIGVRRSRVVKNVMVKQTTQIPANTIIVAGHPRLSCSLLSRRYSVMAGVSASVSWSGGFPAISGAMPNDTVFAG